MDDSELRKLIARVDVALYVQEGAAGQLIFASDHAASLFGADPQELRAPEFWLGRLHSDDRERALEQRARAAEAGKTYRIEYRIRGPAGSDVWVRDSGRYVEGHVEGVLVDISAEKAAQLDVERSANRYRLLFEGAADYLVLVSEDGHIVMYNDALRTMLGYSDEELREKTVFELVPPGERERIAEKMRVKLEGERLTTQYEALAAHRDGIHLIPVETKSTVVVEPDGTRLILAIGRDITERRRQEKALREKEAELRDAHKMEALGLLAGRAARDFDNVLSVIKGHADALLEQAPQDLREDVLSIRDATEHASAITRQLLTFARREASSPARTDVNPLIRTSESMLRQLTGETVELVLELAEDLPQVEIDPAQLKQVVLNLVANARDALPAGGRIVLETEKRQENGERSVALRVVDTGVGMDEATRARMFEPFFTTKEQGTGLGLAHVYGIVMQAGGRIAVDSAPGAGTRFEVVLRGA
jgi:two-component system cell cycle sensor histidine kinase/response regulator CckA